MFVLEVTKALHKNKVEYALIGGYALAFHGIVRATMDVDIAVSLNLTQLKKAETALNSLGLKSRLPLNAEDIVHFRKEYIKKRKMIVWSFLDFKDPTRAVDILLTRSLKSLNIEHLIFKNQKIYFTSLKDLLKLKQKTPRLKDQLDVQSIKELLNEKET